MKAKLILEDNSEFEGVSFGSQKSMAGEVVFSTGMMGYPESLTDPSYKGQILVLTYPLVGNYGVPKKAHWESDTLMVSGLIVSNYIDTPSHFQTDKTLSEWFKEEKLPLLEIKDTRLLTQKIRTYGTMLGKIIVDKDVPFYDPNKENLVAQVSTKKVTMQKNTSGTRSKKTLLLIDCGAKRNIQNELLKRGADVITVPWDYDPFSNVILNSFQDLTRARNEMPKQVRHDKFDAVVVSNGPGDPKQASKTIQTIQKALKQNVPILGICLGHQLLALAAGGNTSKLKFGHRSQNQPCTMNGSKRCFITTHNHGFAVSMVPSGFKPWFTNANDNSNEGIIHTTKPIMSVQFHPEATPGPTDTDWIFDYFLKKIT